MRPVRLQAHVGQTGFLLSHMASGAAVHRAHLRQPYLFEPGREVAFQRKGIGAGADQLEVSLLVVAPFAEKVLRGRDGQHGQQHQAHGAEGARWIAEQLLP